MTAAKRHTHEHPPHHTSESHHTVVDGGPGTCSPTFHCSGSHWSTYRQHAPRRPIYIPPAQAPQTVFHTLRRLASRARPCWTHMAHFSIRQVMAESEWVHHAHSRFVLFEWSFAVAVWSDASSQTDIDTNTDALYRKNSNEIAWLYFYCYSSSFFLARAQRRGIDYMKNGPSMLSILVAFLSDTLNGYYRWIGCIGSGIFLGQSQFCLSFLDNEVNDIVYGWARFAKGCRPTGLCGRCPSLFNWFLSLNLLTTRYKSEACLRHKRALTKCDFVFDNKCLIDCWYSPRTQGRCLGWEGDLELGNKDE